MSEILPNGKYTISSAPHSSSTIYLPARVAPIVGKTTGEPQTWIVHNTSTNVVTITNGVHDTSQLFAPTEEPTTPLTGAPTTFQWNVHIINDVNGPHHYFTTKDDQWTWFLTSGIDDAPVVLQKFNDPIPNEAKWNVKQIL